MSIFSISDLHLPLGIDKPMDIFGHGWHDYVRRIEKNWIDNITDDDTVLIPGDISWATYPEQAREDLLFIEKLPGKKIISKGNHDYWWPTLNKLNTLCKDWDLSSVKFLYNTACICENYAVTSSRGWITPDDKNYSKDDEKIYNREKIRLTLSLDAALSLSCDKIILMMHYPPLAGFFDIIKNYPVDAVVYGHLHGAAAHNHRSIADNFFLCSADYLEFLPKKLKITP